MSQLAKMFEEAKVKYLKREEELITSLFKEGGKELIPFRFDGFSFWNKPTNGGAEELWAYLRDSSLYLDPWRRGVWTLRLDQALKIAQLTLEWNAAWEHDIAYHHADLLIEEGDIPNDYYNAYHISFSPATGSEHTIKAGFKGYDESWQW